MTSRRLAGPPWTIRSTLQWTIDYFQRHHIETPRIDAEILLAHGIRCRRIDLYLRYDQPLNPEELECVRGLLQRRVKKEPVAYIVGSKEFWSMDFKMDPSVLIPRPETEVLVEQALDHIPEGHDPGGAMNILDLGTGSGAIITALAHERPGHRYWATDVSPAAVSLARRNANRHLLPDAVTFWAGRWYDPMDSRRARFDIIVTNPPYIPSADIQGLASEIRYHEPRLALDGGPDGLRDIKYLIGNAPDRLKPGGWMLLEIGDDQWARTEAYARSTGAYNPILIHKDYAGRDRVVCLRRKNPGNPEG